jgi:hypothetical protein
MKRWDRLVDGYLEEYPRARDWRGDDQPYWCTSGSMKLVALTALAARIAGIEFG